MLDKSYKRWCAASLFAAAMPFSSYAAATVVIQNGDAPNVGFNDPTPVAPVGGNAGITRGEQRLIAFQSAADKWGATLTSSTPVTVLATWEALSCTSTSAVLGSAGALEVWNNFAGAPKRDTWYSEALANALYMGDLDPEMPEIRARFNVNLGQPGCLEGAPFYLGLDANHGAQVDLMAVLTHELGHGLGFQTFTNGSTGAFLFGLPSIWDYFLFDNTLNKPWVDLTAGQRAASSLSLNHLVWNGPQVMADVPKVLQSGAPRLTVNSPTAIAGSYPVGTASFGPALMASGITGEVSRVIDTAPSLGLACTTLSDLDAASVAGKIALVDRGSCTFATKARNVQDAGAIAVLIVNNLPGAAPALGGADPSVTIPAVGLSLDDGNRLKEALSRRSRSRTGVQTTLGLDLSVYAGADTSGRPFMYAPNPYQPGSSVSHWDTSLTPNQLMEPSINGDLTHEVTVPFDLTYSLLQDIGWQ